MYEGLKLTELHEEWAWRQFHIGRGVAKATSEAAQIDAEIRARVAAQEIIEDRLPKAMIPAGLVVPLRHGIPDAERAYPAKRKSLFEINCGDPAHWTNHSRHAVPVEGCHLCHPQPTRWTPGGFVHEEHVPCE